MKMYRGHKIKLPIVSILFVVGVVFCIIFLYRSFFISEVEPVEQIQSQRSVQNSKVTENAEIVIYDLILKEIEKHRGLQVTINAHEGKIVNSDDKIQCKIIYCSLCNKDGQVADLRASDAIIDKSKKNIFLNGVAVAHFENITINGEEIYYDYSDQILCTKKQTEYLHPNFKLSSQQSIIDFKNYEIKMSGGVQSTFLNCSTKDSN